MNIGTLRLYHQQIAQTRLDTPEQVVAWLGGMQAQDYPGAKWSIGLRLTDSTDADVERAIAEHRIIRTWPIRGTLHFVAAPDARWMLALTSPRNLAGAARRRQQLELDDATLARAESSSPRRCRAADSSPAMNSTPCWNARTSPPLPSAVITSCGIPRSAA